MVFLLLHGFPPNTIMVHIFFQPSSLWCSSASLSSSTSHCYGSLLLPSFNVTFYPPFSSFSFHSCPLWEKDRLPSSLGSQSVLQKRPVRLSLPGILFLLVNALAVAFYCRLRRCRHSRRRKERKNAYERKRHERRKWTNLPASVYMCCIFIHHFDAALCGAIQTLFCCFQSGLASLSASFCVSTLLFLSSDCLLSPWLPGLPQALCMFGYLLFQKHYLPLRINHFIHSQSVRTSLPAAISVSSFLTIGTSFKGLSNSALRWRAEWRRFVLLLFAEIGGLFDCHKRTHTAQKAPRVNNDGMQQLNLNSLIEFPFSTSAFNVS